MTWIQKQMYESCILQNIVYPLLSIATDINAYNCIIHTDITMKSISLYQFVS